MQPPVTAHAPHSPQPPHRQVSEQVRVRSFSSPQVLQAVASASVSPAKHSPSLAQTSVSHWHVDRHVRRSVPQLPHEAPSSIVPGLQTPVPVHAPSFCHSSSVPHTCACVPQLPQLTLLTSPAVQEQSVGASQAPHCPITQLSMPGAHALMHERCAVAPTIPSLSLQSLPTAMPSPSASASGDTQRPC